MAIAVVFEFPNESLGKYDEVLEMVPEARVQPARSPHVCFETSRGFTVIDVWQSEPSIHPVHNTM